MFHHKGCLFHDQILEFCLLRMQIFIVKTFLKTAGFVGILLVHKIKSIVPFVRLLYCVL
jgi:hypothetical protein